MAGLFLSQTTGSVVVATGAVHVTVRQFFFGRNAHFGDFHVEMQRLAGQRMVTVHGHHIALDARDHDGARAGFGLRRELHAGTDFALKGATRDLLNQTRFFHAISILGRDGRLYLVARHLAFQGRFETWNDAAVALEVRQRIVTRRRVEHLAGVILERVVCLLYTSDAADE